MKHRYTTVCGILFFIVLAALLTDVFSTDNQARTDGPRIALTSPQKLPVILDGDTTFVPLAKGDSIRILGITRLTGRQKILVKTANGDIGSLDVSQVPLQQIYIKGKKHKGDTILKLEPNVDKWGHIYRYTATTASGEEITDVDGDEIVPTVDGWEDYSLDNNASTSIATQRGLEEMKGKSLDDIEKKYGMAYNVLVNKDSTVIAGFRIYAYGDDGKLYSPTVSFGADGNATDFTYEPITGKMDNSWLLSNGFARMVIDMPVIRALTRSETYSISGNTGKSVPWYLYVLLVLAILVYVIWYLATPSVIVLLMGWLIAYRFVFYPIGNGVLKSIIILLSIVCTAVWMVALMAWGMFWLLPILVIPVSFFSTRWACAYLESGIPSDRCPHCKRLETISFDHKDVTGTEYVKKTESERHELLDSEDQRYQTWTQVTTRYSDGSTESHREDVRNRKRRFDTYSYIDYEVTYLVTHYLDIYKCAGCGHMETDTSETWEEVDRTMTGMHTGTESYDV